MSREKERFPAGRCRGCVRKHRASKTYMRGLRTPVRPASVHPRPGETLKLPAGNGRRSSASGQVRSSQAIRWSRLSTTIWRSWNGARSAFASMVRIAKASGQPLGRRPPDPGKIEPVAVGEGVGIGSAAALVMDLRSGDQAAMARKAAALGAHQREGPASRFARPQAPRQLDHLDAAAVPAHDDAALSGRYVRSRKPLRS